MRTYLGIAAISLIVELAAFAIILANAGPQHRINPPLVAAVLVQAGGLRAADMLDLRSPMASPMDPGMVKACESGIYRSSECRDPGPGKVVVFLGGFLQTFLILAILRYLWRRFSMK